MHKIILFFYYVPSQKIIPLHTFHTALHVWSGVSEIYKRLKEGFFFSIDNLFLNVRASIHQGDDEFSYESRGRKEVPMILSSLLRDQLWPIHQWRCEEINCVLLHGDALFLENFVRELLPTANEDMSRCFVQDVTIGCDHFPSLDTPVFIIREATPGLLNWPDFWVPLLLIFPVTAFPSPALTFTLKLLALSLSLFI